MNWGNVIVNEKSLVDGKVISMKLTLNLDGDYKTTKNKFTWVSRKGSINVKTFEYGNLQNDLDSEDLAAKFNKDSKKEIWLIAENAVKDVKDTETVQFERFGFYYCDKFLNFNLIPFTKQKRTE